MGNTPNRLKPGYIAGVNRVEPERIDEESKQNIAAIPGSLAALIADKRYPLHTMNDIKFAFNGGHVSVTYTSRGRQYGPLVLSVGEIPPAGFFVDGDEDAVEAPAEEAIAPAVPENAPENAPEGETPNDETTDDVDGDPVEPTEQSNSVDTVPSAVKAKAAKKAKGN